MSNELDKNSELVSVIVPAFNADSHIGQAIESVLAQEYENWELIVIDNNSEDRTKQVVLNYSDPRIKYYFEKKSGVSYARNTGLAKMNGDFFCFLDADDQLTPRSISARLYVFKKYAEVTFVDGIVRSLQNGELVSEYRPNFYGNPRKELAMLKDTCFFGITWMIRRDKNTEYKFRENMTHGEDLMFYLDSCAEKSIYSFVEESIYLRHINPGSAMTNVTALEKGYLQLVKNIQNTGYLSSSELKIQKRKVKSLLFKIHLRKRNIIRAFSILFSNL